MTEPTPPARVPARSPDYLTVDQAAAIACVRPRTIRAWLTKGYLTRYRIADGYHVRIARTDLAEHLHARMVD